MNNLKELINSLSPADFERLLIFMKKEKYKWDYKQQAEALFEAGLIPTADITKQSVWNYWSYWDVLKEKEQDSGPLTFNPDRSSKSIKDVVAKLK